MPFRTISINAFAVGLCSLIPLPFVDEWVRKHMMKGAYLAVSDQLNVNLEANELEILARSNDNLVLGCLHGVFLWPIKKLFKTVFFFLLIKDCADWAAEAAIRGAMVRKAIGRGVLPGKHAEVRGAMDRVWKEFGQSPFSRFLLRKPDRLVPWGQPRKWFHRLVARLVRHGSGAAVLEAFENELALIESGRPLALPDHQAAPDPALTPAGMPQAVEVSKT